jgi:hypothetical protein
LSMSGQHIEREARYELTGMTQAQRLDYVRRVLVAYPRTTERQVAKWLTSVPPLLTT